MGARESIYQKSGVGSYYRMTPHHHEAVKQIWESIEKNSTIYVNGFFVSVCDKHPEFTKYFSKRSHPPLNIDTRMAAKFTLILETIGYILLDCYDKLKQLDKMTGYCAMVHKDMRLSLQDFLNFSYHLVDYLTLMFPAEMTTECQKELKKYFSSISHDIVSKIEDFRRYEIMGFDKPAGCMPCSSCLPFTNKLIFGQTLLYWKDRTRSWDNRMSEWNTGKSTEQILVTSTEDEESTFYKSKTEDELSEWTGGRTISFDRQGLHRRTQMLISDLDSTTYVETDGRRTDGTSYSDLRIVSSTQQAPRPAGNFKKPGSQNEKLYIPKHVTVKTDIRNDILAQNLDELRREESLNSYSPRQRFRSRRMSHRIFKIPINDGPETQNFKRISARSKSEIDTQGNRATTSARQRRRMRVSSFSQ